MKPIARLVLGDAQGNTHAIPFEIEPRPIARRWAESLVFANRLSRIRESNRLYNFPHPTFSSEELIVSSVDGAVTKINGVFPGLIPYQIDRANPQHSINQIHGFFADTGHGDRYKRDDLNPVWNEFNNSLHAYESLLRSRRNEAQGSDPSANVVVTWDDPIYQDLEDEDYKQFTVAKRFGTCYVNYCQIGRHLFEMFQADDEIAADDHILPLRRLSADTYIWFGSTTGPKSLKKRQEDIEAWFRKHEPRLNALGFRWGDPRLAIGWIPVATLDGDFSTYQLRQSFMSRLSGVDRVIAFGVDA